MARTAAQAKPIGREPDDITVLLRAHGLRPTNARVQLLAHLFGTTAHPSAEQITASLREVGVGVGVATVYQNLNRLVDAGLVRRMSGSDGRSRFDADMSAHDHAVCDSCGRIADVDLEPGVRRALDRATAGDRHLDTWLLTRTAVEVHGLCPECRAH
ncbi:MAG: Fur family transcriptional regulator [Anaerosomatales bacterium]|nr:Fur family transcriptional regulator [Anaerosomatales bacterium]MDT8434220.1 Fur family transcriptional regulator [Anaerosomatales bacterium]